MIKDIWKFVIWIGLGVVASYVIHPIPKYNFYEAVRVRHGFYKGCLARVSSAHWYPVIGWAYEVSNEQCHSSYDVHIMDSLFEFNLEPEGIDGFPASSPDNH